MVAAGQRSASIVNPTPVVLGLGINDLLWVTTIFRANGGVIRKVKNFIYQENVAVPGMNIT